MAYPQRDWSIESALLYSAYRKNVLDTVITAIAVTVGGALLWTYLPLQLQWMWATVMACMCLVAALNCWAFYKVAPQGENIVFWQRVFVAQVTLSGLCWSVGPVLMLRGPYAVLFVGILFCVSAVAVASLSEQRAAMQGFVLGAMLPATVVALIAPFELDRLVGMVLLGGLMALIAVGRAAHMTARSLLESQLQLQAVLADVPDAVVGIDALGRVTNWNHHAETIFGWKAGEILGTTVQSTLVPEAERFDPTNPSGIYSRLVPGRRPLGINPPGLRTETTAQRKSGEVFPIDVVVTSLNRGGKLSYTAFITDITERERAKERLHLFRQVFDSSDQCVGIFDGQSRVVYQNQAAALEMGYSDEEMLGAHVSQFIPVDSHEAFSRAAEQAAHADRGWAGQIKLQRKDGSVFTSVSNVGFIRDTDGKVLYSYNIYTDFSAELARRAELAQAKDEAVQANHAKSEFLSSMSHELRTPMNAILGFAQMLEYDDNLNADQKDNAQEILKAGKHLLTLINEVLDLAKIESGKVDMSMESVGLQALLQDCQDLIQPLAAERQVRLMFEVPPDLAVRADHTKLKQALINLLSNAVKYNREGGSVTVTASLTQPQDPAANPVHIAITDTGVGIAAQRLGELFQPFSRLGAEAGGIEGTGIGLTITRRLVELMGGTVGVRSTLGQGTTFWIALPQDHATPMPAAQEQAAQLLPPTQPSAAHGTSGRTYKLLSVDDNPSNVRLMEGILARRPDYLVTSALSPERAIELAMACTPDLILLDVDMPGLDGYQILGILKADARFHKVPVIAVSANAMPRDVERGLAAGFNFYVTKPLDVPEFLKCVDACLQMQHD